MKNFKRILALVLAVMMVVAGMVSTSAAADKVEYNETAIARLKQLDIFKGRTSGDAADSNVTREEMAKALDKRDGEKMWNNIGFNYLF